MKKYKLDKPVNEKWKERYSFIKETMEKLNRPYKIEVLSLQPEKYYKVVDIFGKKEHFLRMDTLFVVLGMFQKKC